MPTYALDEALTMLSSGMGGSALLSALRAAKENLSGVLAARTTASEVWNLALGIRDNPAAAAAARDLGYAILAQACRDDMQRRVLDDDTYASMVCMATETARAHWRSGAPAMAASYVAETETLLAQTPAFLAKRLAATLKDARGTHLCTRMLLVDPPEKRVIAAIVRDLLGELGGDSYSHLEMAVVSALQTCRSLSTVPILVDCLSLQDKAAAQRLGATVLQHCVEDGREEHAAVCCAVLRAQPSLAHTRPGRMLDAVRLLGDGSDVRSVVDHVARGPAGAMHAEDALCLARVVRDASQAAVVLQVAMSRHSTGWSAADALQVATSAAKTAPICEKGLGKSLADAVSDLLKRYAAVWRHAPTADAERALLLWAVRLGRVREWASALQVCETLAVLQQKDMGDMIDRDLETRARTMRARALLRLGRYTEARDACGPDAPLSLRLETLLISGDDAGAEHLLQLSGPLGTTDEAIEIAALFSHHDNPSRALAIVEQRLGDGISAEHATERLKLMEEAILFAAALPAQGDSWNALERHADAYVCAVAREVVLGGREAASAAAIDTLWNACVDMQQGGAHVRACALSQSVLRVLRDSERRAMFCALHVQNAMLAAEAGAAVDWAAVGAVAAEGCALSAELDARTGDALRDLCGAARLCAQIAGGEAFETSDWSEAALEIALRHAVSVANVEWPFAAGVLVRELARRASQRPDTASVARLAVLVRGAVASAQAASEEGTACIGNLIEALGNAAEAVKRCGRAYPPAEIAWLCATAHNAALALVSAPGQSADALRHAAALGGHAVALAAAMADGPLRRRYEPAVRGLHARLLIMAADSGGK